MKKFICEIPDTKFKHFRSNCPRDITDLVFLETEKFHILTYNSAIKLKGVDHINQFIGRTIREQWDLKNLGRCNQPKSKLITSYKIHSN